MPSRYLKNIKLINVVVASLIILLIFEGILFAIDSTKIVLETNKDNFAYTSKIRDTVEEIDKIVERAQVNVDVVADTLNVSYDTSKLHDEQYNKHYLKVFDPLVKAALINSPGVDGAWFQINADLVFHTKAYSWYILRNGKIINFKEEVDKTPDANRKLTPEDDPYYFEAVKNGKLVWSKIYTDVDTNTRMLTISEPVVKHDTLIGVVGIDISVESMQQALNNMQSVFLGSEVYLVDEKNQIILSQLIDNKKKVPTDYFAKIFKDNLSDNQQMAEFFENGVHKTAIILSLSNKYHIILTFPNGVIFKGFDRLWGTMSFMFLILLTLSATALVSRNKIAAANKNVQNEINKLKIILDSSPSVVMMKNLDGIYTDCNQKFLDVMKIKKEDFIGKTDYDLFDQSEIEEILENDRTVKETGKMLVKEAFYYNSVGEKLYVEKYIVPIFDADNELKSLLIIGYDITKRAQEKELLKQAKESAEKATLMKSNFLANMSHEIRTPMNGVLGFLQLLEDTNPTEEQSEFIADAQVSSELLLNLINEILDFSKIEAGKLKIDNISFDIRSVVEDVTIMNTATACSKGLDINSLICSDVPQRVFGDPGRVKQILNNLVGNALKFTSEGGIVIYVNQVSKSDEETVLSFRVKDTGIGIPEEKLKMIFESFTQADASTTRKYGGTGLGLAISQKLAELMNGGINVESNVNEGSTFTLTLTLKKDTTQNTKINDSMNSLKGTTILVLEDNCTDSKIIRYYLNEANCTIKNASSRSDALDIINQDHQNISAILIDYKMENAGEIPMSSLIKANENSKNIPLILYTSMALRGDAISAKERGFIGYLTKPLKKHELIESISIAINHDVEKADGEFITKHFIKETKFDAKTKILMVEDIELNCIFIQKLLNRVGLSCDIVNEGKSAIEALKAKTYDIVLMDCQMPIMDGYEATREIRKMEGAHSHTPVIAMTANAMDGDAKKCIDAGMDDYLSKPVKAAELFALIGKYAHCETKITAAPDTTKTTDANSEINSIIQEMVLEVGFAEDEAMQLFEQYLEFSSQTLIEIKTAIENDEFENLKRIAHKLKGASANVRIEKIAQLSGQLETESPKGDKEFCLDILTQIRDYQEHLKDLNAAGKET